MNKKKVYIDLNNSKLFGVSCKCIEMLEDLRYRGYKVKIIGKDWSSSFKKSGLTYDKKLKGYVKGDSQYLWDPKTHPDDFYINLICSTFENVSYEINSKKKSIVYKIKKFLKEFSPFYFSQIHFLSLYSNSNERRELSQQILDGFLKNVNLYSFIVFICSNYALHLSYKLKVNPCSRGFRYKLSTDLLNEKVTNFINNAKKQNKNYVLISPNWDDKLLVEPRPHLKRGINYEEIEFNSMVRYVQDLDKYAQEGKIKFVLASKKVVDWPNVIESEHLDLRNFEEYGFTLSQTIYIIQEITSMTINMPTTFSIWVTNIEGILHLSWSDQKDSAVWSLNSLHKEPVEKALKLIGVL